MFDLQFPRWRLGVEGDDLFAGDKDNSVANCPAVKVCDWGWGSQEPGWILNNKYHYVGFMLFYRNPVWLIIRGRAIHWLCCGNSSVLNFCVFLYAQSYRSPPLYQPASHRHSFLSNKGKCSGLSMGHYEPKRSNVIGNSNWIQILLKLLWTNTESNVWIPKHSSFKLKIFKIEIHSPFADLFNSF